MLERWPNVASASIAAAPRSVSKYTGIIGEISRITRTSGSATNPSRQWPPARHHDSATGAHRLLARRCDLVGGGDELDAVRTRIGADLW